MSGPVESAKTNAGAGLAATLGLICLAFLPLVGGGYSGSGYQVGLVLLPLAAAIGWAVHRSRPPVAIYSILLFLLSGGLMLLWQNTGNVQWFYLLTFPSAWIVTWVLLRDEPQRAEWLWPVVNGSALLTALYGLLFWYLSGRPDTHIVSTFGLHNAYAGFLLCSWPLALVGALTSKRTWLRLAQALATLILVVTLVLTYSRASWIALVLQLVVIAVILGWRQLKQQREASGVSSSKLLLYCGAGVVGSILLLLLLPPVRSVLSRVADFDGYSMLGRLRYWQASLEMFADSPLLGIGLGGFSGHYPAYQQDFLFFSIDPHSWVFQLVCELGILGILIGLLILAGSAWWAIRLWRSTGGSPVAVLLIAALGGSLAHAAVDFDYTFSATLAVLGVLLAYGAHLATPQDEEAAPQPVLGSLQKWFVWISVAMLLLYALAGEALTAERYILDRWREAKDPTTGMVVLLPEAQAQLREQAHQLDRRELRRQARELTDNEVGAQRELLTQAVRYNPLNHFTRRLLARNLAMPGNERDLDAALEQAHWALRFNPRDDQTLYLLAGLLDNEADIEELLLQAIELNPYNFPEYYNEYAQLTSDDEERKRRVLWALDRFPIDQPMEADFIRVGWGRYNEMFADWYYFLYDTAETDQEKEKYRTTWARFQAYLDAQAGNVPPGPIS